MAVNPAGVEDVPAEPDQRVAWLARRVDALLVGGDPRQQVEFLGRRFDAGLAWVWFPPGRGGLGIEPELQFVVDDRLRAAGVTDAAKRNVVGYGMGAPILVSHGRAEQQDRFLRPLFQGSEPWCQLFSEPGAGSDLAGLSTRARRDGDGWRVDGQKVWTSLAHTARRGMLLARTDPNVPKHRGLTLFVLDMESPGVEVRPLRQMTGDASFNEVFLSDVHVPDADRVGAVGDGWSVAMATLALERQGVSGGTHDRSRDPVATALALWAQRPGPDALRDRLVRLWIDGQIANRLRQASIGATGPQAAMLTGVVKLALALLNQRAYDWCVDAMGMEGTLFPNGYAMRRPTEGGFTDSDARWAFLRARANTIEGGTTEIVRNVLAERTLGLPREERGDTAVPWSQVRRV